MNSGRVCTFLCHMLASTVILAADSAQAELITIDMVTVGNPVNQADTRYEVTGVGMVRYVYQIAKYEVTAGQYTAFLNAVAKTDPYTLYSANMSRTDDGSGIARSGAGTVGDPYTYTVASDFANRPVNYVSFWDAARFTNWLHNGQGVGGDTETGAYALGGFNGYDGRTIARNPGAKFFIPNENEWYKAAYHKNDGVTGNYWDYPTGVDTTVPGRDMTESTNPGNNANYYSRRTPQGAFPIDFGRYTTVVGEFHKSESPYGTFDQGGNVSEWTEGYQGMGVWWYGRRGGAFDDDSNTLSASFRGVVAYPLTEDYRIGFRIASSVPEITFVAGDVGKNGRVDIFDVAIVQAYYLNPQAMTWDEGDFDGNGTVDIFDVALMQVNYGYGVASSSAPVPEPSTLVLAVLGVLGIMIGWWRRCA